MNSMNNNLIPEQSSCPLCKSNDSYILSKEMRRGKGIVYYCKNCQHGFFINEGVFDEKTYYAEEYRREYSHNAKEAATNAREIFDVYKNYQENRLEEILPYLDSSKTLLEVGASSGQFLKHILHLVKKVDAIELDKDCCHFLQNELNISADNNYLRESKFAKNLYDVVCSFQVLEHVADPINFLKELRKSVARDGLIFIEVPNLRDPLLSTWGVEEYNKFFFHSAHLHYFTEFSLKRVAIEAGFKEEHIKISFTQDYNLLNHLHWIMNHAPQTDCHVGLSKISLPGENKELSTWLTKKMAELNQEYVERLISIKSTSNMMMTIVNEK